MNMLKYKSYIANGTLYIVLCTLFVACSGDDLEQYAQRADNADEIGFMPKAETVTRADYSPNNPHPATMGVFGYHDLSEAAMNSSNNNNNNKIFYNKPVSYVDGIWAYSPTKYWPEYSSYNSFDFFGYMPYESNANFTYSAGSYKLSLGVTLDESSILEGKDLPLICNTPHHKDAPGEIVDFKMDQTMMGFQLKFKLGTKMSKVREFEITNVTISGDIPYKGSISRTYTYKDKTWTQGNIVWSNVDFKSMTLNITNQSGSLTLSDDNFYEWGSPFYAIPVAEFVPMISVTYNVRVAEPNRTITRENVTNTIVFNEDNFANLKNKKLASGWGKLCPLEIAIVPDHLYILADADQYIGTLAIE